MSTPTVPSGGLTIGQGFQDWIKAHQATPLSNESYLTPDLSMCQVQIADGAGKAQKVILVYNKLTNAVDPAPNFL